MDLSDQQEETNSKPKKSFPYQKCNKVYTDPRPLRRHIEITHEKLNFTCDKCENKFRCKESLKIHVLAQHEEQAFTGKKCEKSFTVKLIEVVRYMVNMEDLKEEPKVPNGSTVPCKLCHKTFS